MASPTTPCFLWKGGATTVFFTRYLNPKTLKGGTNRARLMVYLTRKTTRGQQYWYLVKSFKFNGRVEKVQHYIGPEKPDDDEQGRLKTVYGPELELAAVERMVKASAGMPASCSTTPMCRLRWNHSPLPIARRDLVPHRGSGTVSSPP